MQGSKGGSGRCRKVFPQLHRLLCFYQEQSKNRGIQVEKMKVELHVKMLRVPSEWRSKATQKTTSSETCPGTFLPLTASAGPLCPTSELSIISCGNSRLLFRNAEGQFLILFLTTWPFSAPKCCNAGFLTISLIISREADIT